MKNLLKDSGTIDNSITLEDIGTVIDYWENNNRFISGSLKDKTIKVTGTERGTRLGFYRDLRITDEHDNPIYKIVENNINAMVGHDNWEWLGSRLSYKDKTNDVIHADDAHAEDNKNSKRYTILTPLHIDYDATTVIFDQSYYGLYAFSLHHDCTRQQRKQITDMGEGYNIPDDVYNNYLKHISKEDMDGLSVKNVIHWKVGSSVYFKCNSLHAVGYSEPGQRKLALGTLIKVNE